MSQLRPGPASAAGLPCVTKRVAVRLSVIIAAAALAGCSTSHPTTYRSGTPAPGYMSGVGYPPPPAGRRYAQELEDDGLPAQVPPMKRTQPLPDDPSEPFSRNYGPPRAGSPRQAPHAPYAPADARPPLPDDLPPNFRRRLAAATRR